MRVTGAREEINKSWRGAGLVGEVGEGGGSGRCGITSHGPGGEPNWTEEVDRGAGRAWNKQTSSNKHSQPASKQPWKARKQVGKEAEKAGGQEEGMQTTYDTSN